MTKGNGSAGGQGSDLPISDAAGGNQSVGPTVWRSRIVTLKSIGSAERGNPNLGSPPVVPAEAVTIAVIQPMSTVQLKSADYVHDFIHEF